MLLFLFDHLSQYYSGFNVFQYLTLRIVMGALTSLVISLLVGPYIINYLTEKQFYQSIRVDGPSSHSTAAGSGEQPGG